ncbi:hypothetical protein NPIL_13801 [Nephila pilipes]|uniref:Uncharacterized protein n=1 Tax=Nephila pilipes TaxID=299642 RepID=A0A8X6SZW0_NEPPI|nr:hypothetical protein NPIL_13801 [Nephila pilipes]
MPCLCVHIRPLEALAGSSSGDVLRLKISSDNVRQRDPHKVSRSQRDPPLNTHIDHHVPSPTSQKLFQTQLKRAPHAQIVGRKPLAPSVKTNNI